jgi:hypothetical protein
MKSTTGAYNDFPEYYYSAGSLFGSYLLGRSAKMSRDTRRDLETQGSQDPVFVKRPRRSPGSTKSAVSPADELMEYVRSMVSKKGAARIVGSLAAHKGLDLGSIPGTSPLEKLDALVRRMSPADQRKVLSRLEAVAEEAWERERRRQVQAAAATRKRTHQPKNSRKKGPQKLQRERRPEPQGNASETRQTSRSSGGVCGICLEPLSAVELAFCDRQRAVLLGHADCTSHAQGLMSVFENSR